MCTIISLWLENAICSWNKVIPKTSISLLEQRDYHSLISTLPCYHCFSFESLNLCGSMTCIYVIKCVINYLPSQLSKTNVYHGCTYHTNANMRKSGKERAEIRMGGERKQGARDFFCQKSQVQKLVSNQKRQQIITHAEAYLRKQRYSFVTYVCRCRYYHTCAHLWDPY